MEKFGMANCNTFHNSVVLGSHLTKDESGNKVDSATQPAIMFVVRQHTRYMDCPTKLHHNAAKRVLRYLKWMYDYGILYKNGGDVKSESYTDNDYLGSGAVFLLSKKHEIVILSTTEIEFVAATHAIWLRRILEYLH
ncbi:secreted RxLR effector protein 161-like [Impatiens glandulifera]|uniref:secreted RxLR effector protein 161-like n=1 Tax=Impatiens glandulifera TaxID=253017 RepID=UPI001FB07C28|nr:secreted RxLR effector protein 161-like [Impatiens glandulifera]